MRPGIATALVCLSIAACLSASAQTASYYEQAVDAAFRHQFDQAIDLYKNSIEKEPLHAPDAAHNLFELYRQLHMYAEAAEELKEVKQLNGSDSYTIVLAKLYQEAGRHYDAQRLYLEILGADADNADALMGMGMTCEALGDFAQAREYYQRAMAQGGQAAQSAATRLATIKNADSLQIDRDTNVLGRWAKADMPITVFIAPGDTTSYYKPEMRQVVIDALTAWSDASHGLVQFQLVQAQQQAKLLVLWTDVLPQELGVAIAKSQGRRLLTVTVKLAIGCDSLGHSLPAESAASCALYAARDRMLPEVALHELGHAIGLNHSLNTTDIMANGIFGLHSSDVQAARGLQPGDKQRIVALYAGAEKDAVIVASPAPEARDDAKAAGTIINKPHQPSFVVRQAAPPEAEVVPLSPDQADMRLAIFDLSAGLYDKSRDYLTSVLNRRPHDPQAHYLMAVTLVKLRQYDQAARHYQLVVLLAPQTDLARRASAGLAKLERER